MSSNVLFFNEIKENDFKHVGGKGLNLAKMIQNNFPVPNGFCVTTIAFDEFIKFLYNEEIFNELVNIDVEDINKVEEICSNVRNLIISKHIPNNIKEDIEKSLNTIGKEDFYAVRSSATAEDLPNMSFAGQQDTYLNIHGIDDLINHIQKCFASLYTQRAVIYRKRNNINEKEVSMCVVVQKIVNSSKSGIMFTADPLTNNYNHLTIDAGFGLGEALVSGLITPDLYKYDKIKGKIIETKINKKEIAIYRNNDGGTNTVNLDENLQNKQVLSQNEINKLATIGKNIEKYYKYPQDIEWAIDDKEEVYILQSRPITSLYPRTESNEEDRVYFSLSHLQVMTAPIKPLGVDMLKRIFPFKIDENTQKSLVVTSAGGRVYIDITDIIKLPIRNKFVKLMGDNIDYLMGNAIENYLLENKVEKRLPSISMIKGAKNSIFYILKEANKKAKNKVKPDSVYEVNLYIDKFTSNIKSEIQNSKDLVSQINTIQKLAPTTLINIFKNVAVYMAPGMKSYRSLITLLEKNNADVNLANKIVSGLEGNVTTEMGLKVGDVSDCIRGREDIIKILKENPKNAHKLILNKNYNDVNTCLSEFLRDYGMRGPGEIDISSPRYQDDFSIISSSIINNINTLTKNEHRESYNKLIKESKKSEELVLKLLEDKNSKDIDKAKNHINNIRSFMCMREHGKYTIIKTFDIFRKVIFEAADKLVMENLISNRDDIVYLAVDEIEKGLSDKINYKEIIKNRKEDYKVYETFTPPRVIASSGQTYSGSYKKGNIPENAIAATPVSSGVYEGYAKVILDPSNGVLKKGEILVTKFTDPGWTPFFINAKGLILEVGGLMTHGAIVAREYGIPALVGMENATKLIQTGDFIRVNADKGYVEILEKYKVEEGSQNMNKEV